MFTMMAQIGQYQVRNSSRLAVVLAGFLVAAPSFGQQKVSSHPASAKSNVHTSDRLPRSTAHVNGPVLSAGSTAASQRELTRLEHANLGHVQTIKSQRPHPASTGPVQKSQHSAPINFSYQGPKSKQIGHQNASARSR